MVSSLRPLDPQFEAESNNVKLLGTFLIASSFGIFILIIYLIFSGTVYQG